MQIQHYSIGQKIRITGYSAGDKAYRKRLISLGLLPGTELTISRIAPLGDPIEISVRGFFLSLRKNEANILKVEGI